ncbi:MAG: hypothetical protein LBO62_03395 [Endomicrobium sp.]|jgi:hypothetical protein|nr:hypothetical protein [Endomicrobium sp.]
MLKKIFLSFIICVIFYCVLNSQSVSPNIGRQVYGLYSEIFLGAKFESANNDDSVSLKYMTCNSERQSYNTANNVNFAGVIGTDNPFEGNNYLKLTASANQAFFITFNGTDYGSSANRTIGQRDMSAYYGGMIKFHARNANNASDTEVGIRIAANNDKIVNLSELNYSVSEGSQWQELTMYLTSANIGGSLNVSQSELSQVSAPFLVHLPSVNNTISIDNILWIKANQVLNAAASFSLTLKNADGSQADKITWSTAAWTPANKGSWTPSLQYIEIDALDYYESGWCAQIYTKNTDVSFSSPIYSGSFTRQSVSGMVNTIKTNEILYMRWRIMKEADITNGNLIYDANWQEAWSLLRDISVYDRGEEEIRFYDRRGYKWNAYQTLYGALPEDKKLRIYFAADMNAARKGFEYKTNSIFVEYYAE